MYTIDYNYYYKKHPIAKHIKILQHPNMHMHVTLVTINCTTQSCLHVHVKMYSTCKHGIESRSYKYNNTCTCICTMCKIKYVHVYIQNIYQTISRQHTCTMYMYVQCTYKKIFISKELCVIICVTYKCVYIIYCHDNIHTQL